MDPISVRHAAGQRTYILTLKFADLTEVVPLLDPISYGGDCWEFRVDLLGPPARASTEAVRRQLRVLQTLSRRLPILFTVRTVSQGGRFPDDGAEAALDLMKMAVDAGCEYIDVEMSWPKFVHDGIRAARREAKLVASHHEFDSSVKWTSQAVRNCVAAAHAVGDLVKLCIQADSIYDALELGLYVRDYEKQVKKPIIAVAMGPHGQLSRFTAPVTFVTHPLIPSPPGSDQLCLADIHRGRHLIGDLPRRRFGVADEDYAVVAPRLQAMFDALGFPYSTCRIDDTLLQSPDFGGAHVPDAKNTPLGRLIQWQSGSAQLTRQADTVIVETAGDGKNPAVLSAHNMVYTAVGTWLASCCCLIDRTKASCIFVHGAQPRRNEGGVHLAVGDFVMKHMFLVEGAEPLERDWRVPRVLKAEEAIAMLAPKTGLIVVYMGIVDEEQILDDRLLAPFSGIVLDLRTTADGTAPAHALRVPTGNWILRTAGDILEKQVAAEFLLWTGREAPVSPETEPRL